MPRVVLYGGKGGVGKTTCAAATGLALAERGEVLVVSTDPAHSLGDAYGTAVGSDPTVIEPGLSALEVDPEAGTDRYRRLFEHLAEELSGAGLRIDDGDVGALFGGGAVPGGDELAALHTIADYVDDDRWDHLVLDTAPTGHTLRLLELPETVSRGAQAALSVRDRLRRTTDAAKTLLFGPYAVEEADDEPFTEVMAEMERVAEALRADRTSVRVVTLAEPMVLAETERLVDALDGAGLAPELLVVNRVLEGVEECCARCRAQRERQQAALAGLSAPLAGIDRRDLPDLTGHEDGPATLKTLAGRLA
jgi:arsenite-transporting ATPase